MRVAGVDGCRAGWVVAQAESAYGTLLDVTVVTSFAEVLRSLRDVEMIAVDIPIGLPDTGARRCDIEARRRLGSRRSTVFPAPPRALLHQRDYQRAARTKRSLDGKGLSKQTFHLLPKIADVDSSMHPDLQARVVEAHPELAFVELFGAPLDSKHTPVGRDRRQDLVQRFTGPRPLPVLAGARRDDVLDAVVLTRTAAKVVQGHATRLGDGARDARGLVMEIVC
jgi:predicted RNase H-like nuclease